MTSSTSPLDRTHYESGVWFDAESHAGVRYRVRRVSVAGRIELARRIREVGRRAEFLEASTDVRDKLEAAVVSGEMDREYLDWGLLEVEGLRIDGEAATPQALIERGPLGLGLEIVRQIKAECSLTDDERKN